MIVQIYRNIEDESIVMHNKDHVVDKEKFSDSYEFIEEFEGKDWEECNRQIADKYFNLKK